jgi:hypothetical protein
VVKMARGRKISEADEYALLNAIKDADEGFVSETGEKVTGQGIDRENITRITGQKGTTLHDRLGILERAGYISRIPQVRPLRYEITYTGQQRWSHLRNSGIVGHPEYPTEIPTSESARQLDLIALQRFQVKFPVKKVPDIYWGEIHDNMCNWLQGASEWKNCVEIVNGIKTDTGKKTGKLLSASTVQINVKQIIGENAHQLENLAWEIVRTHAKMLETQGYELGQPQLLENPEFEIASEIAKDEIEHYGWARGVRDKSTLGGEFLFSTADDVMSFKDLKDTLPAQNRALHRKLSEAVDELKMIGNQLGELTLNQNIQGKYLEQLGINQEKITKILKRLLGEDIEQVEEPEQTEPPADMYQ